MKAFLKRRLFDCFKFKFARSILNYNFELTIIHEYKINKEFEELTQNLQIFCYQAIDKAEWIR
jgi:hypothetical protein